MVPGQRWKNQDVHWRYRLSSSPNQSWMRTIRRLSGQRTIAKGCRHRTYLGCVHQKYSRTCWRKTHLVSAWLQLSRNGTSRNCRIRSMVAKIHVQIVVKEHLHSLQQSCLTTSPWKMVCVSHQPVDPMQRGFTPADQEPSDAYNLCQADTHC